MSHWPCRGWHRWKGWTPTPRTPGAIPWAVRGCEPPGLGWSPWVVWHLKFGAAPSAQGDPIGYGGVQGPISCVLRWWRSHRLYGESSQAVWGCTAPGSEHSCGLCRAVRLHRLHGAMGHWLWGDPMGFMGPWTRGGPADGVGLQDLGAPAAASWCRLVLCPCHGMQGTLRAPFACYFFYSKGSSGCFPEQQESRLVFPVLPGRAGRAVPEPGRGAEHPAKPQPPRWALHGAAQRPPVHSVRLSGGCSGLCHGLGERLGLST